jgi:hypothetical protein
VAEFVPVTINVTATAGSGLALTVTCERLQVPPRYPTATPITPGFGFGRSFGAGG